MREFSYLWANYLNPETHDQWAAFFLEVAFTHWMEGTFDRGVW